MPAAASTRRKAKPTGANEEKFTPILDIDLAVPARQCVRLRTSQHPEGKLYELVSLDEWGIAKQHKFWADATEFGALWAKGPEELSEDESQRMKMLLDRLFDQVLDIPATVKRQFNDAQRQQVINSFLGAPITARPQTTS